MSSFIDIIDGNTIFETITFVSYILICAALFKSRFSRLVTGLAFGAAVIVIAGVQTVIALSGDKSLMLTLFPLTAYLPFSVLLFFLSYGGIFETAAACSVGTLGVLILKSLQKVLTGFFNPGNTELQMYKMQFIINMIVVLVAVVLVFITFRFIGSAFRFCIIENTQNRLLLSVPIVMIFLMMFYYLNSTTNEITLIFTMFIAISIFFIIAKQLNLTADLMRVKRSEKELSDYINIQRRGYDRIVSKMESLREYRHDMRHHLAVIEGLVRQKEYDKAIEYTNNLNGSFAKTESAAYCKNPEINAILSEYISRAESAGCQITQSFVLPDSIPFDENDVCIVLANALENAINACLKLSEEKRYINISVKYADGRRLLVSVENPFDGTPKFGENGLPITDKSSENPDEHGIGLQSVKHIVEKYNGFLRCIPENGEFVFQAMLFYDNGGAECKNKSVKSAYVPKRVASAMIGLGLSVIIMLNVLPSVAEAASELLSVDIRTIKNLNLGWGSSSISIQNPIFDGSGADELNSAVKNYTDEAKEKFLWYFNRKYNGYVAEEMRYTVIRDDEKYFIARFNVTINAGGSMDYSRWITFDKSAGKVLTLSDMFKEGADYIGIISAEIREQMIYKNEHAQAGFFIDGDDGFTGIDEDANFYIDSFDRLVIVFDEYEVGPGYMGSPEFFIPSKVIDTIGSNTTQQS